MSFMHLVLYSRVFSPLFRALRVVLVAVQLALRAYSGLQDRRYLEGARRQHRLVPSTPPGAAGLADFSDIVFLVFKENFVVSKEFMRIQRRKFMIFRSFSKSLHEYLHLGR